MKACVFVIFQLCPWIVRVGDWALKWTEGNPTVQVFFVMLFFPVVMNAIQYYIIDGFIKNQKLTNPEMDEHEEENGGDRRTSRSRTQGDEGHDRSHEDEATLPGNAVEASDIEDKPLLAKGVTKLRISGKRLEEYDPATDGELSPVPSEIRRRNSPGGNQMTDGHEHTVQ